MLLLYIMILSQVPLAAGDGGCDLDKCEGGDRMDMDYKSLSINVDEFCSAEDRYLQCVMAFTCPQVTALKGILTARHKYLCVDGLAETWRYAPCVREANICGIIKSYQSIKQVGCRHEEDHVDCVLQKADPCGPAAVDWVRGLIRTNYTDAEFNNMEYNCPKIYTSLTRSGVQYKGSFGQSENDPSDFMNTANSISTMFSTTWSCLLVIIITLWHP